MTITSDAVVPAPMEGHGAYNRSSVVQAAGSSPALPFFAAAAAQVGRAPTPEPIVIADYGASQGHNSLEPIRAAVRALRARVGAERAISVVHTDLPTNDFSGLFQTIENDPASYRRDDPACFALAVGRSFYEQLLPAASVTLGWSAWAVQWLSQSPCPVPDNVQVADSRDAAARAAFARRAEEDWALFLTQRGRELRPGGRLVVLTMALTDAGDFGYGALLQALNASLEALVADGFVRAEEARRMTIPTVGRSRADLTAPFGADGSFAGLTLEHVEVFQGDDPIWRDFEREGDARAFGARWAAFTRASVLPTLASQLDGGADDPRRSDFVARLEAGLAERLGRKPAPTVIPLAIVVLAR